MTRMWLSSSVNVFPRRTVFELFTPEVDRSYQSGILKSVFFLEKRPLDGEKIRNFATKLCMWTWIHVFLPSFLEIRKAEVGKTMRGRTDRRTDDLR